MNIVDAIRKMCEEKNGFRNLFNKALSYEKLRSLVDDKKDAELDRYIRTGEIEDQKKKERIDTLHKKNLFKLKLMPVFEPDIPSTLKL